MTSNPPQILPLTIFQAVGESALWLAGTLLCKELCRDGSCLDTGFLHVWAGEHRPKEPSVLHLVEKTYRLPNQCRGRERSNTIVISIFEYS